MCSNCSLHQLSSIPGVWILSIGRNDLHVIHDLYTVMLYVFRKRYRNMYMPMNMHEDTVMSITVLQALYRLCYHVMDTIQQQGFSPLKCGQQTCGTMVSPVAIPAGTVFSVAHMLGCTFAFKRGMHGYIIQGYVWPLKGYMMLCRGPLNWYVRQCSIEGPFKTYIRPYGTM